MNHDETNSKSDPKPENPTGIDQALEARVVAWVAGEASAFESAELERLIAAQPELAVFKRRIEAVHGLMGEASRPDREPLQMSAERRAKVLQAIGASADGDVAAGAPVVTMPLSRARPYWSWRRPQIYFTLAGAAAAGVVALFVTTGREGEFKEKRAVAQAVLERAAKDRESAVGSAIEMQEKFRRELKAKAEGEPHLSINLPMASDASVGAFYSMAPQPSSLLSPKPTEGDLLASNTPTTSPSILQDKAKISIGGAVINGQASVGRPNDEANRQLFLETPAGNVQLLNGVAPQRPAPAAKFGMGGAGARIAGLEAGQAGGVSALAAPPTDPIVKLDAFTVSADRDVGYGAMAISSSRSAVAITPPLAPPLTFGDSLRADLAKKVSGSSGAVTDGRVVANSGVVLGAGTFSNGAKDEIKTTESLALSTLNEKSDFKFGAPEITITEGNTLSKSLSTDLPLARPTPADKDANDSLRSEVAASSQPESTFSLHVSDVSFRLAQAALARGELPDADRIRPEEFYNAFNYGDPVPTIAEKVGAKIEQSAHPFLQQRNFVRIAVKVPATGRGAAQPLRLTVLLDTSGSMEREDRAATVRRALQELIALLGPNDRITLIGFSRQPRLLAEAVAGNQAGWLVDLAAKTPAEGGTNLEAALKLGGDLARRHALAGAQNRIVVLTDGAANLGNADPDQLAKTIEALRQQNIAFDACGIGLDGLDDAVLEALTRRGDGRYYVLNSPDDAGARFAKQLAGAFRPAAENVKLQVRFNAARVGHYRLIGFEQHRLKSEDFRNDRVDAAELAAEEAAVALYQVEVLPEESGELGEVAVRFRDAASGQMVERSWAIPYERSAPAFDRATKSLQLAGTSALFAEKLRGGTPAGAIRLRDLAPVVNALRGTYANEPRVQEFVAMFAQARRRLGE